MASRRSRVQGAWATPTRSHAKIPPLANINANIEQTLSRPAEFPSVSYLENSTEIRNKPADIVIKEDGEHVLSNGPTGVSKIYLSNEFLSQSDADHLFALLFHELPWSIAEDKKYGSQPRSTLWYGNQPYAYSGVVHPAKTDWHPALESLCDQLQVFTGESLNSVACILYRDGHDSIGWHSDDEPVLGVNPFIASISVGDTRTFELRKKPVGGDDDYTYCQCIRMHLPHGCLLTMQQCTQSDWQHRIPREYHDRKPRINLTFRKTVPLSNV